MNSKYFMFAMRVVGMVADALEDGKITQEEVQDFVLFLISEVSSLLKRD